MFWQLCRGHWTDGKSGWQSSRWTRFDEIALPISCPQLQTNIFPVHCQTHECPEKEITLPSITTRLRHCSHIHNRHSCVVLQNYIYQPHMPARTNSSVEANRSQLVLRQIWRRTQRFEPDEGNSRNVDSPPLVIALSPFIALISRIDLKFSSFCTTTPHYTSLHFTYITVHHTTTHHTTPHIIHPTSFHLHYSAPHHTTPHHTTHHTPKTYFAITVFQISRSLSRRLRYFHWALCIRSACPDRSGPTVEEKAKVCQGPKIHVATLKYFFWDTNKNLKYMHTTLSIDSFTKKRKPEEPHEVWYKNSKSKAY